jgi:hypothetical protein
MAPASAGSKKSEKKCRTLVYGNDPIQAVCEQRWRMYRPDEFQNGMVRTEFLTCRTGNFPVSAFTLDIHEGTPQRQTVNISRSLGYSWTDDPLTTIPEKKG